MFSMNMRKQIIGENMLYAFIWIVVLLVPFMNVGLMSEDSFNINAILLSWLKILPFFLLFICNNNVLLRFLFYRQQYIWFVIINLTLTIGIFTLIELYERSEWSLNFSFSRIGEIMLSRHISLSVFPWYGNMLAAAAMNLANLVIKNMYRSMQSEEDRLRLEKQNIQAEMYYLKYQINPHFFMNTLNNIHALVDFDTEGAKRTIIELSNMMRYVVYDSETDSISLKKDIAFIESYISLMRIRYPDDLDIRFNYPRSIVGRVVVPPLIFIVFVENAFKHGVSYKQKSFIHIDIDCAEGFVTARFENSSHGKAPDHKPGIGLDNVRKRLDLVYEGNYNLKIEDNEDKYCVTLKIPVLK